MTLAGLQTKAIGDQMLIHSLQHFVSNLSSKP